MTSELFSSVYKEKSDHLFDDRIFSCPVPAFTHWSIFVPLSENPYKHSLFRVLLFSKKYQQNVLTTDLTTYGKFVEKFNISRRGEAWYRAWFGTRRFRRFKSCRLDHLGFESNSQSLFFVSTDANFEG